MTTSMDERTYDSRVAETFRRVLDLFEDVDPGDADAESSGDVLRIDLARSRRIVLNTQRPVHQLWLAGGQSAWHFSYDEARQAWHDDKGRGELFAVLRGVLREVAGLELPESGPR